VTIRSAGRRWGFHFSSTQTISGLICNSEEITVTRDRGEMERNRTLGDEPNILQSTVLAAFPSDALSGLRNTHNLPVLQFLHFFLLRHPLVK
jgi:hypothetical protein